MKRLVTLVLAGACAVALMAAVNLGSAEEKAYTPKVVTQDLFDGALDGLEGKRTVIKEFTLPAGHEGGAHSHPAHVFVYVVSGELTIDIPGKPAQTFTAGQLYRETVGEVMVARNASTSTPTKIVVFQIGDAGKPMMVKAPAQ